MNEPTFQRHAHDKKNPYVMISREMAQDKSISPKAKGVLLYLLSLPNDWKIYHSQLCNGLGVGEDYVNSAMEELLNNGYAERTREKVKGLFQPYKYKIYEFKKSLPDRENQPGSSGPENPGIQSKHSPKGEQKKQQQAAPPAAVFSDQSNEKKPKASEYREMKTFMCLRSLDMPHSDKFEISSRYDEDTVKNAIAWATHPDNPPKKCLAASIKHACKNGLCGKEYEGKNKSPCEKVKEKFTNGNFYNNAECFLSESGISFSRGMLHDQVNFDKFFSLNKIKDLCAKFQIPFPKLI